MISARSALVANNTTGPVGPFAFSALLVLLVAAPLMRGGNRHVAMIVLETVALAFLAATVYRIDVRSQRLTLQNALLLMVCLSPAWLALVYLMPLPAVTWSSLSGRAEYLQHLANVKIPVPEELPLSLVPAATKTSLLAGIPLAAAFVAGLLCSMRQFRTVCVVILAMAALQTIFGMLQVASGHHSALFAGSPSDRPLGTFANPNHLANYLAMGLCALVWLVWTASRQSGEARPRNIAEAQALQRRRLLWIAAAVLLVVGVLMTRSRGAALSGLVTALAAIVLIRTASMGRLTWRGTLTLGLGALAAGIVLVGLDSLAARFDVSKIVASAPARTIQAATTLEGARDFWPVGSGWGTYGLVYPRYQPASLIGTADYAHQDYAQLLFEGGIFAVALMAAVGSLLLTRAVAVIRGGLRRRRMRTEEVGAAICGLGLLGFLLHSLVEFNMHIPANAILAALLAGAYLRPLELTQTTTEDT